MKILILHTSSGHGHKKIAENIAAVLSENHDVELKDIFEVERGRLVDWGTKIYLYIISKLPWLWKFFYTNKVFLKATLPYRTMVAGWRSEKLGHIIMNTVYDVVISTQTTPSSIVSYLKANHKFFGKFVIAFSDFHLHPYWMYDNADYYLANIPDQKEEMIKMGVPAEKIAVCGITIPRKKEFDETEMKRKYGVVSGEKVVLVLGGGIGFGIKDEMLDEVDSVDAKIFIVCGKNKRLFEKLSGKYSQKGNIKVFGYIDCLPELYSIADIVLTKPGGLTVAECLNYSLPILITQAIPGQEEENYDWLTYHNLVLPEFLDFKGTVEDEISTQTFRKDLRNNPDISLVVQHGEPVKKAVENL